MKTKKLYPFSCAKHAHDIEFRRNRVKNELDDYLARGVELSGEEYDRLCKLKDQLDELLLAMFNGDGRICYLTGEQIGLAKECVLWATERRSRCRYENT